MEQRKQLVEIRVFKCLRMRRTGQCQNVGENVVTTLHDTVLQGIFEGGDGHRGRQRKNWFTNVKETSKVFLAGMTDGPCQLSLFPCVYSKDWCQSMDEWINDFKWEETFYSLTFVIYSFHKLESFGFILEDECSEVTHVSLVESEEKRR